MAIKVIGIATGSKDVEVWHFEKHDDLCKKFCETLARETGRNVIVIEGEVIGTYSICEYPVNYIPFSERFDRIASDILISETFSGKEF
jgi:hypothetical protein